MLTLPAWSLTDSVVPGTGGAVCRTRVAAAHPGIRPSMVDEHLRVVLPAARPWPALADVLLGPGEGRRSAAELAARHPGALVVAVRQGCEGWLRLTSGGRVSVLLVRRQQPVVPGEISEWWSSRASLAHAWLVAGLSASTLRPLLLGPPGDGQPMFGGGTAPAAIEVLRDCDCDCDCGDGDARCRSRGRPDSDARCAGRGGRLRC